ncbi:MAG: Peptidoglycan D,D-transpeptidase MrdA [Fimbriimonadaceae bacterium]|nr:Peptidoglycan D,D-transpeptidase MrdA [Fimbriimonadaceae bacterium]
MSVIHAPIEKKAEFKHLIVPVLFLLIFVIFFLRLWYLQVAQADNLRERAEALRTMSVTKLAPRGLIVDRKDRLLAGIKPVIVITAKPREIQRHPEVLRHVSDMTGIPLQKLEDEVAKNAWLPDVHAPITAGVSIEVATRIAESQDEYPGIGVESQPMRYYPDTKTHCHILGYVWTPNDKDVKRLEDLKLKPPKYVGKVGIEYIYEPMLMGSAGREMLEVNARRTRLYDIATERATPGKKLILTLDAELQRVALQALAGRKGGVAAIDPATGEVLALVSSPTFDAAWFEGGISRAQFKMLQDDPDKPQFNRAIAGAYAPGSTFKIVTTLASTLAGQFNPHSPVFCGGSVRVGNRNVRCMSRHGSVAFQSALAKSCNVYFITLGMRAGENSLRKACAEMGLGAKTGIDLLGESGGIVPTDAWIKRWRPDGRWYPGDTANFSIGQGEISCTPLQMAHLISIVANNGVSHRPHLVKAIQEAMETATATPLETEPPRKVAAPLSMWTNLRSALVQVIQSGTARRTATIPGLEWGGKTGSAENRANHLTHSWFVGFAPADKPRIAIAVLVENAGHGGDVAAPIAAEIVRHHLFGERQSEGLVAAGGRSPNQVP